MSAVHILRISDDGVLESSVCICKGDRILFLGPASFTVEFANPKLFGGVGTFNQDRPLTEPFKQTKSRVPLKYSVSVPGKKPPLPVGIVIKPGP